MTKEPKWARRKDGYKTAKVTTRLILLRHGITEWNIQGRFQGSSDIPLHPVGLEHAYAASDMLVDYGIDAIYSSPLVRAVQTASELSRRLSVPITTDARLAELDAGEWEGAVISELIVEHPELGAALREHRDIRRSDSGETIEEVGHRVAGALTEIAERHAGQTVLISSHGMAVRAGAAIFTGLGMDGFWRLGDVENCHWMMLGLQGGLWRIFEYSVGPEMPEVAELS